MDKDKVKLIAPLQIKIKSDNNVIDLIDYNRKSGMYIYKYTVSKTKHGLLLTLTEHQLIALIELQRIMPETDTSQVLDNQAPKKTLKKTSKK